MTTLMCFDRESRHETFLDVDFGPPGELGKQRNDTITSLEPAIPDSTRCFLCVPLCNVLGGSSTCSTAVVLLLWCICERFQMFIPVQIAKKLLDMVTYTFNPIHFREGLLSWQARLLEAQNMKEILQVVGLWFPSPSTPCLKVCCAAGVEGLCNEEPCKVDGSGQYAYCAYHRFYLLGYDEMILHRLTCSAPVTV